jgi:hypothetical protein
MPTISSIIWSESVSELASRWEREAQRRGEEIPMDGLKLARKASERARKLIDYLGLPEIPTTTNLRDGESSWVLAPQERAVEAALLKHLGCNVHYTSTFNNLTEELLRIKSASDVIIIVDAVVRERLRMVQEFGMNHPVPIEAIRLLHLCEEVHDLAADRIGPPAQYDLVNHVARHCFGQYLTGLPFNGWAVDLYRQ